jgi:hypothetical protein
MWKKLKGGSEVRMLEVEIHSATGCCNTVLMQSTWVFTSMSHATYTKSFKIQNLND